MKKIPENVKAAWEQRRGPIVFATINTEGTPNVIYAAAVKLYDDQTIIIADNYFHKTKQNIQSGSRGTILFITEEGKAYQIKGRVEYHTKGSVYEEIDSFNPPGHPGVGVAAIKTEEFYSGAEKLA